MRLQQSRGLPIAIPNGLGYASSMQSIPRCKVHDVELICPACIGAAGGARTSKRKAEAARTNGRRGGRPRKRKQDEKEK